MGTPFGAVSFSGGQYASTPHTARLDFAIEPFTAEIWFKGTAAGPLANKFASGAGWQLEVLSGGSARATVGGVTLSGGSSLLNNAWHHIELGVDRSFDKALLFVDGVLVASDTISGSTANSAAVQIARSADGLSTLTGALAEFRLSSVVRHTEDFPRAYVQNEDDGPTRLLWHMNEGKGSTLFDSAADAETIVDAGTRYNGTITGGPGTWVYGPLQSNPVRIVYEALWYALDQDAVLRPMANNLKLKRHRGRRTDPETDRILERGLEIVDCPGMFLLAESTGGIRPRAVGYHQAEFPITLMAALYQPSNLEVTDWWWAMTLAVTRLDETDAGSFLHYRVQNWEPAAAASFFSTRVQGNTGRIGYFIQPYTFKVNCDIRTAGVP